MKSRGINSKVKLKERKISMEITKIYDALPAAVKEKAIELAKQVKATSNNSKTLAKSLYDLVNDVTFKGMKSDKNPKKPMGIAEFADKYFQGYLTGAMAHKYYTAFAVLAMHDSVLWDTLPIGKLCIASAIRSKKMADAGASSIKFYSFYLNAVHETVANQWKEYHEHRSEIQAGIDSTASAEVKSILENQLKQIVQPVYPENYLADVSGYDFETLRELALADFALMSDKDFSGWVKAYKEYMFPETAKNSDSKDNESGTDSNESKEPEQNPDSPETWAADALQNLEKYVKAVPGCSPKIKAALSELRKLCGTESKN
jgi:hypothetical protein